jgi:hypothetical protein
MPFFDDNAINTSYATPAGGNVQTTDTQLASAQQGYNPVGGVGSGGILTQGAKLVGLGLGSVGDLADQIVTNRFTGGLFGVQRGALWQGAANAMGAPGLNDFYLRNKDALEMTGGVAGLALSAAATDGLALPALRAAGEGEGVIAGIRGVPFLRRIVTLDKEAQNAMEVAQAGQLQAAATGAKGLDEFNAMVSVENGIKFENGQWLNNQTVTGSAQGLFRKSQFANLAVGARNAAVTELVNYSLFNRNDMLYSDSAAQNLMWMSLGVGAGALTEYFHAGYQMRKAANADGIRRAASAALDPNGMEESRLKAVNATINLPSGSELTKDRLFTGGAISDDIVSRSSQINTLRNAPLDGEGNQRELARNRERMATQQLEIVRQMANKLTVSGISGLKGTSFTMGASLDGAGKGFMESVVADPTWLKGTEELGVIPDGRTAFGIHGEREEKLTAALDQIHELLENPTSKMPAELGGKDLAELSRRLDAKLSYTPFVQVNNERMSLPEGELFTQYKEPTLEFVQDLGAPMTPFGKPVKMGTYAAKGPTDQAASWVSSQLGFGLRGGQDIVSGDLYDVMNLYRAADSMVKDMAARGAAMVVPENPHWFQLDLAEELMKRTNGEAKIQWPQGMDRNSAQVESFAQKIDAAHTAFAEMQAKSLGGSKPFNTAGEIIDRANNDFRQVIGWKESSPNVWHVTFDGRVPGDSRGFTEAQAMSQAQNLVAKDPEFRSLVKQPLSAELSPDAMASQLAMRFNLPRLSAAERLMYDQFESPIQAAFRGMRNTGGNAVRNLQLSDLKRAVAEQQGITNLVTPNADNIKSMIGNSFSFMQDQQGQPTKALMGYSRPMNNSNWTTEDTAYQLAANKRATLQRYMDPTAHPDIRQYTQQIIATPEFQAAVDTRGLTETQIRGSVTGAPGQSIVGASLNAVSNREMIFRDNPTLQGALGVQDTTNRIARSGMQRMFNDVFGGSLNQLKNPRNANSLMLLNQFHTYGGGWDLAKNPVKAAVQGGPDVFQFILQPTEKNQQKFKLMFGRDMPKDQPLLTPHGRTVVLDSLGLDIQSRFNKASDHILGMRNTNLDAAGLAPLQKSQWYIPPPNTDNKQIAYVFDEMNRVVPHYSIIADSQSEFRKKMSEMEGVLNQNAKMGWTIRTQNEVRNYMDLWDLADIDFIDPGVTPALSGQQGMGKLGEYVMNQNAFQESTDWIGKQYQQEFQNTLSVLTKEQRLSSMARAKMAAPDTPTGGGVFTKTENTPYNSVHDYYIEALTGRSAINSKGSPLRGLYDWVDGTANKLLSEATPGLAQAGAAMKQSTLWKTMTAWSGRASIWQDSKQSAEDFNAITQSLAQYMPFKNNQELIHNLGLNAPQTRLQDISSGLNQFTAATLLRVFETAQGVMNMAGIVNAAPAVVRQYMWREGDTIAAWEARTGRNGMLINLPNGESIGVADYGKMMANGFRRAWSPAEDEAWAYRSAHGYVNQEIRLWHQQFGSIQARGDMERAFLGDNTITNPKNFGETLKSKGLVGTTSWLSDKSEDLSRSWAHMIGVELADSLGMTGMAERESFAHDVANKMIANYSPQNRPEIFQGPVGSPLGLFQAFMWEYYSRMFKNLEQKDFKSLFTQLGSQGALFGMHSVPGWNEFNGIMDAAGGNRNGMDDPRSVTQHAYGIGVGDLLGNGVLANLPTLFGAPGINLYSRGDANVRLPIPGIQAPAPVSLLMKMGQGVAEAIQMFADANKGVTPDALAELTSNMIGSRPLAGMMQRLFLNGDQTDGYGQLVSDTHGYMEGLYRIMGVRSERQSDEIDAFYANKSAMQHKSSMDSMLRLATRAALRDGNTDAMPGLFSQYVENGGDPRSFSRYIADNYKAATQTRGQRQLLNALQSTYKDPSKMAIIGRLLDSGVSMQSDRETPEPDQWYGPAQGSSAELNQPTTGLGVYSGQETSIARP